MTIEESISDQIKRYAATIGFDACGICKAGTIGEEETGHLKKWLANSYHADMTYMKNHFDKRCDPTILVEGAKSIISLALNYYPHSTQQPEAPQFAYYAYGKDYHDVVKGKLQQLLNYIKELIPNLEGRMFCDTAPVMERYWAAKSGIGFIGKNSLLILPKKGSFFFLGQLIVNKELRYDSPLGYLSCGNCTRCIDACPTKAITKPKVVDARKCISYQTIENKGEIDKTIITHLGNRFYGCDICQQVCPWNRYARLHSTPELDSSKDFMDLSFEKLDNLTVEEYQFIFRGSAVKRAKYSGLKRNIEAIKQSRNNKQENNNV